MDPKKLSVVLPLTIATALIFAGTATLEGLTFNSTHSLNVRNLRIRSEFNNFLESKIAKNEQQKCSKNLSAVSNFVKNNGRGTLIATKNSEEKLYTFEYFEGKHKNTQNNSKKIKVLKDWQAVEQYLKDINDNPTNGTTTTQTGSSISAYIIVTTDTAHSIDKTDEPRTTDDADKTKDTPKINDKNQKLRALEEKLIQTRKRSDDATRRYYTMFPSCSDGEVPLYHPLFYKLTQNDQEKIKEKHREHLKAMENWMLKNPPYCMPPNMVDVKEAEIRLNELKAEFYDLQVELYSKVKD